MIIDGKFIELNAALSTATLQKNGGYKPTCFAMGSNMERSPDETKSLGPDRGVSNKKGFFVGNAMP